MIHVYANLVGSVPFKNLHTFDQSKNFKTWAYTIATNTVYDYLRRKHRSRELFIIDDPESAFETIDEDTAYKEIEDKEVVEKALGSLKPLHQTILMMYYKDELTYEEIASHLRIPLNTVKTHLYRAKRALKDQLS
ncbi:MAG: RNA polymerase, sigma-24 subunit, ECF subfamily [Candidatus Magasanikbacteria bacterium GW2011_GWC2_45_8]|uniref:RNA polymerase, sigma-24 subunit, ECF subfamily n=1 Tax=Candidatus Magasanikbacteria bacterium GW2011_GWC2_45_8 TaxID=1619050 RepID=A0A0G1MY54_9BACT|nr:MAG: RNA polymerase, sigma-24 subunit, ECF subfamily [Candidatus Magasanikbacteria bacterium GW2011_GWC2_45_8]